MIYLVTSVLWIVSFMLIPKYKKKENVIRTLIMAAMAYECYLCMVAGLLAIIHISVNIHSISVVNLISIAGVILFVCKKRQTQMYSFRISDAFFVCGLMVLIGYMVISRFTVDLRIVFQTSDPSIHLKGAMELVNNGTVDGMYIGQLMNGLMIEALGNFFTGEMVYKSFIIQYSINLFMAAAVFWAVAERYSDRLVMRILGYIITCAYVLGYPYNDMLFGFVYLQMTVTVICYLIALMQDYLDEDVNLWFWGILIGMACLGTSIGYTLFAPPVYISVLICVIYKAKHVKFSTIKSILQVLEVFALPTLMTVWFILIEPRIGGVGVDYGSVLGKAMVAEGGIYRNLYSDFLLYSIPAIYGVIVMIKKKKMSFATCLIPVLGIYYVTFWKLMIRHKVSTYYFYKLNYLLWMIVLVLFVVGMYELFLVEKVVFTTIICGCLALTVVWTSGREQVYQSENGLYLPYADSETFFRIYSCNKTFLKFPLQRSDGLVEVSGVVQQKYHDEEVVYIGYWENLYWYNALTDQRNEEVSAMKNGEALEHFYDGDYGEYAVVEKDSHELNGKWREIRANAIYENDYAFIIKR